MFEAIGWLIARIIGTVSPRIYGMLQALFVSEREAVNDATGHSIAVATVPQLDDDSWSHVFSFLTITDCSIVCSTCKSHRKLMARSRQHITFLGLNNRELHRSTMNARMIGNFVMREDAINIQESSGSVMFHSEAYFAAGAWPPLSRLVSYYSGLRKLRLSVQDSVDGMRAVEGVAQLFDQRVGNRPVQQCGPLPWVLLPCSALVSLQLHSPKDVSWHEPYDTSGIPGQPLRALFLSAIVPCAARLCVLDLTSLGSLLVDTLLTLELPCLRLLQLGCYSSGSRSAACPCPCDAFLLPKLGRAFPTLTALDIGGLHVEGGVQCAGLATLCTCCTQMRHLDLIKVGLCPNKKFRGSEEWHL